MQLRRVLAALVLSLVCLGGAQAASLEKVRERGALEIAAYRDFPPFSYRAGERRAGIDVELGRALADKLGVRLAVRMVGADETVEDDLRNNVWKGHYIGGGTVDVMMHVPFDPAFAKRNDRVRFLTPYFRERIAVVAHPERAGRVSRVADLDGLRIGVELDTLADFYLLSGRQVTLRDDVVHFANLTLAAAALRAGEIDAIMGPQGEFEGILGETLGDFLVSHPRLPGLLRHNYWDVGLAVRIDHQALAAAVVRAMSELRDAGTIRAIFARHGVGHRAPAEDAMAAGYRLVVP